MSMRLTIDVEARGGPSLRTVFRPLLEASAAASRGVEANLAGGARGAERGARAVASAYRTAYAEMGASAEEWRKRADAASDAHKRKALANMRELESEQHRASERMAADEQRRRREMPSAAARTFGAIGRSGVGLMRTSASAMGFDVDLPSLLSRGIASQSIASTIANAGYMEGDKGPNGQRADTGELLKEMKTAADAGAVSIEKAGQALYAFTKKSSDLQLGRDLFKDISEIALATGADLEEVATNAGDIARKIGDVPNKREMVKAALLMEGKQGKKGAIDYSELVSVVGATVGPSGKFEGGIPAAMAQLNTLLQHTKASGETIAGSATAVRAFVGDLTSAGGLKHLHAGGLKDEDIFADKGHTTLRGIDKIIARIYEETGGDLGKLSAMVRNKRALAAVQSFEADYTKAGGGKAGIDAILKSFADSGARMSEKEIRESVGTKKKDDAAQAQLFANAMEEAGNAVRAELLPAVKELAPHAVDAAHALAGLVHFGKEHPEVAIVGALTAAIGKAAMGDAIGRALTTRLGSASGPIAVGVASFLITKAIVENVAKDVGEGQNTSLAGDLQRANTETSTRHALAGQKDPRAALAEAMATKAEDLRRLNQIRSAKTGTWLDYLDTALPGSMTTAQVSEAHQDKAKEAEIKQDLAHQQQVIAALNALIEATRANKPIPPGAPGPAVNEAARSGGVQ